ncbi:MAG: HAD-IA family hydrolase [Oscillospiraceae bacterium]|nr:HAD-IA family hydrolase [Oscillospiraceae bacterium]
MKEKQILLFDLDGTLTDPKEGITKSYQYALSAFGIEEELNKLAGFIGPPLRDTFRDHYGFSPADVEKAVAEFRVYFSETGLLQNEVYPSIHELLRELNGKTLAVATNKALPYAQRILDHFDLSRYFTFISGDDMEGNLSKNGKKEIIRIALDALGVTDPSAAVMIGDRKHDIFGAKENGLDSIGLLYGYGSREELTDAGATIIVEDVENLLKLLKG